MFCHDMLLACFLLGLPPEEYDYEPVIPYHIVSLPSKQVNELCKDEVWGCVILGKNYKVIIVRDSLEGEFLNIVLRHEKAHINGWRHD